MYHHSLSGSILNISTVHLNGIWQLIMALSTQTCIRWTPCIRSGHYSIPRGCLLSTGFTVSSKKFIHFPPKHNPPVRGNNSWEQAAFWHEVKVVCLHYVSTIEYYWSIDHCLLLLLLFLILFLHYFCFLFISHYFTKTIHGPGPRWGSMDPGPCFGHVLSSYQSNL